MTRIWNNQVGQNVANESAVNFAKCHFYSAIGFFHSSQENATRLKMYLMRNYPAGNHVILRFCNIEKLTHLQPWYIEFWYRLCLEISHRFTVKISFQTVGEIVYLIQIEWLMNSLNTGWSNYRKPLEHEAKNQTGILLLSNEISSNVCNQCIPNSFSRLSDFWTRNKEHFLCLKKAVCSKEHQPKRENHSYYVYCIPYSNKNWNHLSVIFCLFGAVLHR